VRRILALKWRLLPLAIAAAVLIVPGIESIISRHQVSQAAQAAEIRLNKSRPHKTIQGLPTRILVPRLSIDLPVVTQTYSKVAKTWPVSINEANYADNTAVINNIKGETLIYGHDTRHVFGPLTGLEPDDLVYVYTNNGHVFKYSYVNSQDVTPTKLSIFNDMANAPAGLKLITCSGDYFQYRHLMSLKLLQAS
jgi:LPXTG-site transpeptidase (sortase) family protein